MIANEHCRQIKRMPIIVHCTLMLVAIFSCSIIAGAPQAYSAQPDVMIRMRPHCESGQACMDYIQYDSESYTTYGLSKGEVIDMDIVLTNPSEQPIQSVQSWISYSTSILKGVEVRIVDGFPLIAPGENAFDEASGIVKLGASNVSAGMSLSEFVFARVKFEVLQSSADASRIEFYDFNLLGQEGHTKALIVENGRTANVIKTRPRILRLYFGENPPPVMMPIPPTQPPPADPGTSVNTDPNYIPTPTTGTTTLPTPTQSESDFMRMIPSDLKVITTGDAAFLVWERMQHPQVMGYNVYYGTEQGRYIQRRSVLKEMDGVTIRGLPEHTRYYFSFTAFDAAGNETEFSQEVAVTIGEPTTSTAPFALKVNNENMPPQTGTSLSVLVAIAIIASTSSLLAYYFRHRLKQS